MNFTDKDRIVNLMKRRKLAIFGSIIFFIATITFYAYSILPAKDFGGITSIK